ncbi:hypothetical protein [Rhodococcus sp. IEGM1428]
MSDDGAPQFLNDVDAQRTRSLDCVETVLAETNMTLANLLRLNVYTTDIG